VTYFLNGLFHYKLNFVITFQQSISVSRGDWICREGRFRV